MSTDTAFTKADGMSDLWNEVNDIAKQAGLNAQDLGLKPLPQQLKQDLDPVMACMQKKMSADGSLTNKGDPAVTCKVRDEYMKCYEETTAKEQMTEEYKKQLAENIKEAVEVNDKYSPCVRPTSGPNGKGSPDSDPTSRATTATSMPSFAVMAVALCTLCLARNTFSRSLPLSSMVKS